MPQIKLIKGCLIEDAWKEEGEIIDVPQTLADAHIKAGTAELVPSGETKEKAAPDPPPARPGTHPPGGQKPA